MRKAIDRLVQMGVLERRGTSGTYLPDHLFDRPVSEHVSYSISEVVEKAGHVPGSKLLYFERNVADETVASKLEIEVGDPIISIQRQRTVDGIPVCIESSRIPARLVPGLSAEDVMENKSLYAHFRDVFQLQLHNKASTIGIQRLAETEADFLGLPPGTSVLILEAVIVTGDGAPFEHLRSLNHPDHVSFTIEHRDHLEHATSASPISMLMNGERSR